jgi:hypothetical protein
MSENYSKPIKEIGKNLFMRPLVMGAGPTPLPLGTKKSPNPLVLIGLNGNLG